MAAQNFTLTLRQVHYQFVARGLYGNTDLNYDRLGETLNVGRLAGLVDWSHMEDRTRFVRALPFWDSPASIVRAVSQQFRVNQWVGQEYRPEVWIEKDALIGVIEPTCRALDVDFFSCRGYVSQSEMHAAAQRILDRFENSGQQTVVLHLGDHDPSGVDMSVDIQNRLTMFLEPHGLDVEVRRIALTMAQVREVDPPPNPAKITDKRSTKYIDRYGPISWELDALNPAYLDNLLRFHINGTINDEDSWRAREQAIVDGRETLRAVSRRWDDVEELVS